MGKKNSMMFLLGHYGLWEWAGYAFTVYFNRDLLITYQPLKNKTINGFVLRLRKKFGNRLVPIKQLIRTIESQKNNQILIAWLADQSPKKADKKIWLPFLNRQTAFSSASERIASRYDYSVIYASVAPAHKRGYYHIKFTPIYSGDDYPAQKKFKQSPF